MGQITQTDVGQMTEDMQKLYMPDRKVCGKAIPEALMLLLKNLESYTVEVQKEAEKQGIDKDLTNVPQFASDMGDWQLRLAHYKNVLEQIPSKEWTTPVGCALAWRLVTAPLLVGFWYEILPGRNFSAEDKMRIASGQGHPETDGDWYLGAGEKHTEQHPPGHSTASVPDMVTPFMLGNQVLVYGQHQQERWQRFKDDLQAPFKAIFDAIAALADLPGKAAAAAKKYFWPFVGAAALGVLIVGGVYYVRARNKKAKANPGLLEQNPEPLALAPAPAAPAIKQPTRRQLAQARMSRLDY